MSGWEWLGIFVLGCAAIAALAAAFDERETRLATFGFWFVALLLAAQFLLPLFVLAALGALYNAGRKA